MSKISIDDAVEVLLHAKYRVYSFEEYNLEEESPKRIAINSSLLSGTRASPPQSVTDGPISSWNHGSLGFLVFWLV
jgi:hypothetical protein